MSRIGKNPVEKLKGVEVKIKDNLVFVKGPKGELSEVFNTDLLKIEVTDTQIIVTRLNDTKNAKANHGLVRSLINNMVIGVTKGYEKRLEIQGVGYRAKTTGKKITLTVGFSHDVDLESPEGVNVVMDEKEKNEIIVTGISKQQVGQFAAEIREIKKPEPYKGKGVRYKGEYVRRKAGKTAKK